MRLRVALVYLAAVLATACAGKYVRPTSDAPIERTPERLKRGAYLVNEVAACGACHTTRASGAITDPEDRKQAMGGGNVLDYRHSDMRVYVPNLTSDPKTGLAGWSDDQLLRAIRDGVDATGRFLAPVMPSSAYRFFSDEDARAVVAYLRSLPPVEQARPPVASEQPFFVKLLGSTGAFQHPPARDVAPPDPNDPVRRGEYLARVAGCAGCHSLTKLGPVEEGDARFMGGSEAPLELPGIGKVSASNLTPDPETGLGKYSAEQLKQALRTGTRLDGKLMAPPMETFMPHYMGLTDGDLDDLVTYLRALPAVKHAVPPRELSPEYRKKLGEG